MLLFLKLVQSQSCISYLFKAERSPYRREAICRKYLLFQRAAS